MAYLEPREIKLIVDLITKRDTVDCQNFPGFLELYPDDSVGQVVTEFIVVGVFAQAGDVSFDGVSASAS
jgi:hypothetical protein